jgi:hypothetical protein
LGLALLLIPIMPTLAVRLSPGGAQRLARVAIWNQPDLSAGAMVLLFVKNYFLHFDPRFLFFSGDANPRHAIQGMGQLLAVDMLLIPLGLAWMWRRRKPLFGALLAAFLCAPLPAALAAEGNPHALRAIGMVLPAAAWGGAGLYALAEWIRQYVTIKSGRPGRGRSVAALIWFAAVAIGLSGLVRYWATADSPLVQVAFNEGARQAFELVRREKQAGQLVFVDAQIPYAPYYQLFFFQPPPERVALRGFEAFDFYYYDPRRTDRAQLDRLMRPGDWLLRPIPPGLALVDGEGRPLIDPDEALRVGETWVGAAQK